MCVAHAETAGYITAPALACLACRDCQPTNLPLVCAVEHRGVSERWQVKSKKQTLAVIDKELVVFAINVTCTRVLRCYPCYIQACASLLPLLHTSLCSSRSCLRGDITCRTCIDGTAPSARLCTFYDYLCICLCSCMPRYTRALDGMCSSTCCIQDVFLHPDMRRTSRDLKGATGSGSYACFNWALMQIWFDSIACCGGIAAMHCGLLLSRFSIVRGAACCQCAHVQKGPATCAMHIPQLPLCVHACLALACLQLL
jgi:hypothetical protein